MGTIDIDNKIGMIGPSSTLHTPGPDSGHDAPYDRPKKKIRNEPAQYPIPNTTPIKFCPKNDKSSVFILLFDRHIHS